MTTGNRKMSQREAAVEAVKNIGLNRRMRSKTSGSKAGKKRGRCSGADLEY